MEYIDDDTEALFYEQKQEQLVYLEDPGRRCLQLPEYRDRIKALKEKLLWDYCTSLFDHPLPFVGELTLTLFLFLSFAL